MHKLTRARRYLTNRDGLSFSELFRFVGRWRCIMKRIHMSTSHPLRTPADSQEKAPCFTYFSPYILHRLYTTRPSKMPYIEDLPHPSHLAHSSRSSHNPNAPYSSKGPDKHHPYSHSTMGTSNYGGYGSSSSNSQNISASNTSVTQALEIARDSEEGARDPVVSQILENALAHIWGKVQAQPTAYVMTRDEFAVFNYFQSRFTGNAIAISARKRYWDHSRPSNGGS
jgi:hypothetical protein